MRAVASAGFRGDNAPKELREGSGTDPDVPSGISMLVKELLFERTTSAICVLEGDADLGRGFSVKPAVGSSRT